MPQLFGRPLRAYFTAHDVGHLHALCGLYVVMHALLRFVWWLQFGRCFLGGDVRTLLSMVPHIALSMSGLLFFPLSTKRSEKNPLLWREGRLHSVIFAGRSLVACLLVWLSLRTHSPVWLYLRGPAVIATCALADVATAKYGTKERTTMRSMPWDPTVVNTPAGAMVQHAATLFYSISQLAATKVCLLSYRADEPFWVLVVVQISAFLFTCVRKGILSASGWHEAYATLLATGYLLLSVTAPVTQPGGGFRDYWVTVPLTAALSLLRFGARVDKYLLWGALVCAHWYALWHRLPFFEFVTDK